MVLWSRPYVNLVHPALFAAMSPQYMYFIKILKLTLQYYSTFLHRGVSSLIGIAQ